VAGLLVQRPTPNLEDQVSAIMTPGDRVVQQYPQALGTHFGHLLWHGWVTVGLDCSLIPATTRDHTHTNTQLISETDKTVYSHELLDSRHNNWHICNDTILSIAKNVQAILLKLKLVHLFICGLFNNVVNCSAYTALNYGRGLI
jgi:hypothetical protein